MFGNAVACQALDGLGDTGMERSLLVVEQPLVGGLVRQRVLYRVAGFTSWCGHGQEFIPMPDEGNWVRLVPIIGTAR